MEIENPMVNDAYWGDFGEDFGEEEYDEEYGWLDRMEEEEEAFYILADMGYDEDRIDLIQHGWGHVNGYHF
jgi:hypothetical protein